jgi:hypothetical protein
MDQAMLEFEREEVSLELVAHSETTPFKSYWIREGAWAHLRTVQGDRAGATVSRAQPYHTLEDAMQAAQEEDDLKGERREQA